MSLKQFSKTFKDSYRTQNSPDVVNVIEHFYKPALSNSVSYDREAGYFSSAIFALTFEALPKFITNKGKIRIICNEFLSNTDIEAGEKISSQDKILYDLDEMLKNYKDKKRTQLMCALINEGILEIKICYRENKPGLYHTKTGIFKDQEGSVVTFNGGVNESLAGWQSNDDSITLEQSYSTGRSAVIEDQITKFEELWMNSNSVWKCVPLTDAVKDKIVKNAYSAEKIPSELNEIINQEKKLEEILTKKNSLSNNDFEDVIGSGDVSALDGINLGEHQKTALINWRKNNYQAILKYCTGSGKTMIAMKAIKEMLERGKIPLVIVDGTSLRDQWEEELKKYITKNIFKPSGKDIDEMLSVASSNNKKDLVILVCEASVKKRKFLDNLVIGNHLFLVVDECHILWAPGANKIIQENWHQCPRLGLSATPEDTSFDLPGNNKDTQIDVIEFFGGEKNSDGSYKFTAEFTIADAIKAKPPVLTEYYYYPIAVKLTEDEMEEYTKLTNWYINESRKADEKNRKDQEKLRNILTMRAKIIKNARKKQDKCIEIISSKNYKFHTINPERQSWLIYVGGGVGTEADDDKRQIDRYEELLTTNLPGINVVAFFQDKIKPKLRKQTLDTFSSTQGVLIGCQMLDQGIDIPELSMAIILSSSKNQRTFIQRRGRLLRIDKSKKINKKKEAVIFDIIVIPDFRYLESDIESDNFIKVVDSECERALQFANDAKNKDECLADLQIIRGKLKARID